MLFLKLCRLFVFRYYSIWNDFTSRGYTFVICIVSFLLRPESHAGFATILLSPITVAVSSIGGSSCSAIDAGTSRCSLVLTAPLLRTLAVFSLALVLLLSAICFSSL